MSFAIWVKDAEGNVVPLPERYRTPAEAKAAWGFVVMRRDLRPERIDTVPDS